MTLILRLRYNKNIHLVEVAMKINVSELLKETGQELDFSDEFTPDYSLDELEIEGRIRADLHLINTGNGILAKGTARAKVKLICGRCLKEFFRNLNIEIEEQFKKIIRVRHNRRKDEEHVDEENLFFPISVDNKIDIDEVVRQNILTAIPIKSLCRNDCTI